MNKVFICGHLGDDPELRTTQSGTAVASLRVATNERRKDRDGEWTDHTEWHTVVVWSGTAEAVSRFCHKGSKITVEGRLQTRSWEDKDGNARYSTEIVADRVEFMSKGDDNGRTERRDDGDDRGRGGRGRGGRDNGGGRGGRGRGGRDNGGGRRRDHGADPY